MAGALLTISVVAAICAGILIGILTGRYPHRRSWIVLAIIGSNALVWTVVLALPGRAPLWLLVVLVVVISVGRPRLDGRVRLRAGRSIPAPPSAPRRAW